MIRMAKQCAKAACIYERFWRTRAQSQKAAINVQSQLVFRITVYID